MKPYVEYALRRRLDQLLVELEDVLDIEDVELLRHFLVEDDSWKIQFPEKIQGRTDFFIAESYVGENSENE